MKQFSRFYVKYVIKTPIIFYTFLIVGISLFIYLSLSLKLDIVQSIKANIADDKIVLNGEYHNISDVIYLYNDRNEKIYKFKIKSTENENGKTVFFIDSDINLSGDVNIDIVIGNRTLFERIFVKAGKG